MKRKFLLLVIALFLITGCGNVQLSNGENAIVTFKDDEGISAETLYNKLKEEYGSSILVDMIDKFLLEKEYETTQDETNYVKQVVSYTKKNAESYNTDYLTYIKNSYGISTEKDFENYIALNYKRNLWITDYTKDQVTDSQIEEYYKTVSVGDIEASHILISTEATDDMTDDEKDTLNKKALETAKDIIKKLDNGEDFASLAKEYSDDEGTASKGGYLGYFNRGKMEDAFEEAVITLNIGEYTKRPIETKYGYHIIYKTNQKEKESLEKLKDKIRSEVASELLSSDNTLYLTALKALREKYEMTIKDSTLKNGYDTLMGN